MKIRKKQKTKTKKAIKLKNKLVAEIRKSFFRILRHYWAKDKLHGIGITINLAVKGKADSKTKGRHNGENKIE